MSAAPPSGRFGARRAMTVLTAGTAVVMLMLTWLFLHAESIDAGRHFAYTQALLAQREAQAQVNSEVLALRLELSRNYDALTGQMRHGLELSALLRAPPDFLPAQARESTRTAAEQLFLSLQAKADLVDMFKRRQAILRNSLAYFPVAAQAVLDDEKRVRSSPARDAVNHYARHLLAFARTADGNYLAQALEAKSNLDGIALPGADAALVGTLFRHGAIIEEATPKVDALVRGILDHPSGARLQELDSAYTDGYDIASAAATRFRLLLYGLALALTAYLGFIFVRLVSARNALATAHRELGERYNAQLLAERQLQLHATAFRSAHDGITLTDAAGNILDVNPAFTRITGYTREEAIGCNPRLLKSGRHDAAFYSAMWASIARSGSWRGEVWNRNKGGDVYPELLSISAVLDTNDKVTNYVAVFADISRLKEQESRLMHLAYFDALTELPNRVLLADRISQGVQQTMRGGKIMALCYLDLDGFKEVNDRHGHEVGDKLLVEMARRLRQSLRGGDTVSRLGGDEFVLLLLGMENIQECMATLDRLLLMVAGPMQLAGQVLSLSASIGVTVYPQENSDPDSLLRQADQAMYQAKQSGKNTFHMFDSEQDRSARSRHDRVTRIREALAREEFVLYYQPKVDLRKGTVVGAEALIRWRHPENGLLPPAEFLPHIEEHDLIIDVGKWVLDAALRQMEHWQSGGLVLEVSVNVAGRQLQHPDFVQDLSDLLKRYPGVADQLELEVLETTALEDMSKVSQVIQACKELGVRFALDDFGTGYSSLTYLKRLSADTIKIDQSFVREMLSDTNNLVIVQGVLGLARAFQLQAIAEGVETVDHGRLLLQLECNLAQGYGIARPMAAASIPGWVENWRPDPAWEAYRVMRWDEADYPLLVAEVEHRGWISSLLEASREGQPLPSESWADHANCRFGVWHGGRGHAMYGHLPGFAAIEGPHLALHELADRFNQHWRVGEVDQALGLITDLVMARDRVLDGMRALQAEIGVPR